MPGRTFPTTFAIFAVLCVLALSACGFQPRGQSPGSTGLPAALAITGLRPASPLHRALVLEIEARGSAIVEPGVADRVIRIQEYMADSRVLSVDGRNKAVEYELEEAATFTDVAPGTDQITGSETVRVLRTLFRPVDRLLAGDREEVLLREDMRRDLASRILRRVGTQP
jgi:LPS-assembly lipoprotein